MALSNIELDNLLAGDDVATDLIATDHYQYIKHCFGADGTANVVTSTAVNPFPVALSDTDNAVLDVIAGAIHADAATYTDSTSTGMGMMGVYQLTPDTVANDDFAPILLNSTAGQMVELQASTASIGVVDLGTTDNTVLDNIQTAVQIIDNSVIAVDAPGGAASVNMAGAIRDNTLTTLTEAEGDAVPLRVSSVGALHVTGSVVAGTEYTEDVVTAAPQVGSAIMMERDDALTTITPAEGDWAGLRGSAEGALWTQDFNSDQMRADLTSIAAAVGGVYAEDIAHTSSDKGVFTLGVRNDTLAALGTADGDYAPFQLSADGALFVEIAAGGGTGGTAAADDSDFVALTTQGTLVQGVYESTPTSVTDGDMGAIGIDVNRQVKVVEASAAAILADTANMDTNLGTIAGAVSTDSAVYTAGTDPLVAIGGAVLTAAPTYTTGDIGALSLDTAGALRVSGGGGGTEYVENVALGATPTGSLAMARQDAALSATGSVDDDAQPLHVDANGALWVIPSGTVTVTATNLDVQSGGVDMATAAGQLVDGHNVTVDNAAGASAVNIQDGGNSITIDGTVTANAGTGTMTVDLGANNDVTVTGGETPADADATPTDAVPVQAFNSVYNGTTWDLMREGGTAGSILVDGSAVTQPVSGTVTETNSGAILADTAAMDTNLSTIAGAVSTDSAVYTAGTDPLIAIGGAVLTGAPTYTTGDVAALSLDTAGALRVSGGGGGTEYVENVALGATPTGSLSMARQDAVLSATGSVDDDAVPMHVDANGALWVIPSGTVTVDGSGVTQPVSGTVTANPASGTIDTVTTVTAVTDITNTVAVDGADTPADADATPTTAIPVQSFNSVYNGITWDLVREGATAGSILVDSSGQTQPVSGTVTVTATNLDVQSGGVDMATAAGQLADGHGVAATLGAETTKVIGTVRMASGGVASGSFASGALAAGAVTDLPLPSGAATSAGQLAAGHTVTLAAGTAGIGKLTANTGVDIGDVDVTSIAAGTNVIGKIAIDGQATSGGIKSGFKSLDLDETEEEVKATAGQLHWIHCVNLHTAPIYLKVYDDTAAGVIVGTDVPDWTFAVPTQGDSNGAGFNLAFPGGQEMTVGITVACTLLAADNDATSPGTSVCIFNCGYA